MKRKSAKKLKLANPETGSTVAEECAEYRATWSQDICEVRPILEKDPELKQWMETALYASSLNRQMQIHHLFGRQGGPELHYHCSIVQVCKAAHNCGDDFSPAAFDIACLAAKWNRHVKYLDLHEAGIQEPLAKNRLYWNVAAMNAAIGGTGLIGRIEGILIPKLIEYKREVFIPMAERLVRIISKGTE